MKAGDEMGKNQSGSAKKQPAGKAAVRTMIFDDVFRTMAQKMPQLMVPLINEIFGKKFVAEDIDAQLRNEFMEEEGKIVTDSIFRIKGHLYHIECQSVSDRTMVIRMFEYDFAIALEEAFINGSPYEIRFPESCVMYLRSDGNTKDSLQMKVIMPDGQICNYTTRVIKVSDYTKEEIFQKNLLCMLPYYILRYEKELDVISASAERTKELLEEYRNMVSRLWEELEPMDKSAMYVDLIRLIKDISDHVLRNSQTLKKEVAEIMGGKILELESERLLKAGRQEEKKEAIIRMIKKHYSKEQILDLGYTESEYQKAEEELLTSV